MYFIWLNVHISLQYVRRDSCVTFLRGMAFFTAAPSPMRSCSAS